VVTCCCSIWMRWSGRRRKRTASSNSWRTTSPRSIKSVCHWRRNYMFTPIPVKTKFWGRWSAAVLQPLPTCSPGRRIIACFFAVSAIHHMLPFVFANRLGHPIEPLAGMA
jgi:hypothetical protein